MKVKRHLGIYGLPETVQIPATQKVLQKWNEINECPHSQACGRWREGLMLMARVMLLMGHHGAVTGLALPSIWRLEDSLRL